MSLIEFWGGEFDGEIRTDGTVEPLIQRVGSKGDVYVYRRSETHSYPVTAEEWDHRRKGLTVCRYRIVRVA